MKYLITNNSDQDISLVGRVCISVPPRCKDLEVSLPAGEAVKKALARLKRTYPLFSFKEKPVEKPAEKPVQQAQPAQPQAPKADAQTGDKADAKPASAKK